MIDTIGFQTKITEEQAYLIRCKSKEVIGRDNEKNELNFRILKKMIELGSHDSKITVRCHDDENVHVELSLPKFEYGHNVFLLYPSQVEGTASRLREKLREYFGDFPPYTEWRVERLDFCYAWKFQDQIAAYHALSVLKAFDYPRKTKHLYSSSVQWSGRSYTLKFYMKLEEVEAHALKELKDKFFSNEVLKLANGVLRFEITCRKTELAHLFGKQDIHILDFRDEDFVVTILDHFLTKLLDNLSPETSNTVDVIKRLQQTFSKRKAQLLWVFYKEWFSKDAYSRQILKENYCQSTIWRKKHDLATAGVGLPTTDKKLDFKLDIPSPNVVNKPTAPATAEGLGEASNTA